MVLDPLLRHPQRAPRPVEATDNRRPGAEIDTFSRSSRARLTSYDLARFSGQTLFDRLGRAVCEAGCLPRKELYEAWEVARRTRRLFRGGRVVDMAGGHGLLACTMLLLDDSSPSALVVDTSPPPSGARLLESLARAWPRLSGRITYLDIDLDAVPLRSTDIVVSSHACGRLTDRILQCAITARAAVAVLPCCHDLETCNAGDLSGWIDGALAVDVMRAMELKTHNYRVWTQTIPAAITVKNRLLLGQPLAM